MGLKTEERNIRGLRVITTQLSARQSFKLLPKIGAILGPALSKLEGVNSDSDIEALAPAMGVAFEKLAEADSDELMARILQSTMVQVGDELLSLSNPQAIDAAFEGNFSALLETMWFSLQVNYADFFGDGALAKVQAARQAKANHSDSARS